MTVWTELLVPSLARTSTTSWSGPLEIGSGLEAEHARCRIDIEQRGIGSARDGEGDRIAVGIARCAVIAGSGVVLSCGGIGRACEHRAVVVSVGDGDGHRLIGVVDPVAGGHDDIVDIVRPGIGGHSKSGAALKVTTPVAASMLNSARRAREAVGQRIAIGVGRHGGEGGGLVLLSAGARAAGERGGIVVGIGNGDCDRAGRAVGTVAGGDDDIVNIVAARIARCLEIWRGLEGDHPVAASILNSAASVPERL